jgi:AcrR family transcriptional regulator
VSPRPYQLGKRQEQIEQSRQSVIDAARALLAEATSYTAFTVDAVARRADVARATVYYQFGSKTGLLEALCDAMADAGGLSELPNVFAVTDPDEALDAFVKLFARFWSADRPVTRRLRALAALDPEVGAVIAARDQRARDALAVLVGKLGWRRRELDERVRVVQTLTSFETFDALAGPHRAPTAVTARVIQLTRAVTAR